MLKRRTEARRECASDENNGIKKDTAHGRANDREREREGRIVRAETKLSVRGKARGRTLPLLARNEKSLDVAAWRPGKRVFPRG